MHSRFRGRARQQIAGIFVALCCIADVRAQASKPQHAKLSLISELSSLGPGSTDWIGLRFQLEPGWHIYWKNPGDSGEPPKVTWHLPGGIETSELQFPIPQRIKDHSLIDYGYEGDVLLLSKLAVPNAGDAPGNKTEITADIRYLVCREVCVPGSDHVALTVPFSASAHPAKSANADLIRKTEAHLPQVLPADVQLSIKSESGSFIVTIASRRPEFRTIKDFLPQDAGVLDNTSTPNFVLNNRSGRLTLKKSEQLDHPVPQLKGLLITADKAYDVTIPITSRPTSSHKLSGNSKE
jgi:thiol:disulfide interchange protein DsbD